MRISKKRSRPARRTEAITRQVHALVRQEAADTMALSTEACASVRSAHIRTRRAAFRTKMYPCVESHGILVTALAEKHDIDFQAGGNLVTWFSLIFYK